ncbi:MAG: ankyrin repeat domain-containing protein [Candidatus Xenobiia bacterium LiM19]
MLKTVLKIAGVVAFTGLIYKSGVHMGELKSARRAAELLDIISSNERELRRNETMIKELEAEKSYIISIYSDLMEKRKAAAPIVGSSTVEGSSAVEEKPAPEQKTPDSCKPSGKKQKYKTLYEAIHADDIESVEELLNKADALVDAGLGDTAMHWASRAGSIKCVKYLIGRHAPVEVENINGLTPLHYAAQEGHADLVEYLISCGAEVNRCSSNGWTPLFSAVHGERVAVVQLLIEKGAALNGRDIFGRNPLSLARELHNDEIVEILKKHCGK